jgi:hypothetical protein
MGVLKPLLTDRLLSPDPVGLEAARRVRVGMTPREVQGILGRPADAAVPLPGPHNQVWGSCRQWEGRAGTVRVHFLRNFHRNEEEVYWVEVHHRGTGDRLYEDGEIHPNTIWLSDPFGRPPGRTPDLLTRLRRVLGLGTACGELTGEKLSP